jgi:hypothetical protein
MVIVLLATQVIIGIYSIDRNTIALTFCGGIFLLGAVLSIIRRMKG